MRTVLLLCLISLLACKTDFLEVVKCVISKPKVQELGLKLFSYLVNKQYSEILPAVLKSLPDLYTAVVDCLSNSNQEIVLQAKAGGCPAMYYICIIGGGSDYHCYHSYCE